jgi:hypothetical protein
MSAPYLCCHATIAGCELTLVSLQHDPRTAQDAFEQPTLTGLRTLYLGRAPYDEVHLATNVIPYGTADASEPIPVDVANEQHVDVAARVIAT